MNDRHIEMKMIFTRIIAFTEILNQAPARLRPASSQRVL
jgi:hypothetical protein